MVVSTKALLGLLLSATLPGVAAAQVQQQSARVATRDPLDSMPIAYRERVLRVATGIVIASSVAQALNAPVEWERSAQGAAFRLGDQTGFLAIRSVAHLGLSRALPWKPAIAACPSGIIARSRCGVTQTLVVYNADGAARPDIARIGSLAIASLGSVLWRPERARRDDARVFVLSRVGSGLAFAAVRRAIGSRRKAVAD